MSALCPSNNWRKDATRAMSIAAEAASKPTKEQPAFRKPTQTKAGRRLRELVAAFIDVLGGRANLSFVQLVDIQRAAELAILAETTRAKIMRDGTTGGDELLAMVRIENMASRAQARLNLKPGGGTPKQTLASYLNQRAERAAEPSSGEAA